MAIPPGARALTVVFTLVLMLGNAAERAEASDPDTYRVDMGDATDEGKHNLVGWGTDKPFAPIAPSGDVSKRYQLLNQDNSVDVLVPYPGVLYELLTEVEDGTCADNFEVYVNGNGPVLSYTAQAGVDEPVAHTASVATSYITSTTATITFRNTATDSCGKAGVYNVALIGSVGGVTQLSGHAMSTAQGVPWTLFPSIGLLLAVCAAPALLPVRKT